MLMLYLFIKKHLWFYFAWWLKVRNQKKKKENKIMDFLLAVSYSSE